MSSTAPTEFLSFPELPPELREMVWNEALPNLDLQRFNAEIIAHPDFTPSTQPENLILCLTPNDDFVNLTSGYVGLLGACRESRQAATFRINGYLPISYIARDADGSFALRFARVPFNPDGHLCISGLCSAIHGAADGHGARGTDLPYFYPSRILPKKIKCLTFPEIKNLTITLDNPRDFDSIYLFMLGWDYRIFADMAKRMPKLEMVALVDEVWVNERHHIDAKDFEEGLHKPVPVIRPRGGDNGLDKVDEPSAVKIPWQQLYHDFKSSVGKFNALKEFRAGQIAAEAL